VAACQRDHVTAPAQFGARGHGRRYHRCVTDARFHPRLRIHAHADIIGAEVVLARTLEDLSLGGCKFAGPAWEEPGQPVALVISFPALAATVPVAGVVVRSGPGDMAVRFANLSDEQRGALRKHIADSQEAAGT
jgi:hypothetical protein